MLLRSLMPLKAISEMMLFNIISEIHLNPQLNVIMEVSPASQQRLADFYRIQKI